MVSEYPAYVPSTLRLDLKQNSNGSVYIISPKDCECKKIMVHLVYIYIVAHLHYSPYTI